IGQRDRHWVHVALVEIEAQHGPGRGDAKRTDCANRSRSPEQYVAAPCHRQVGSPVVVRIVLEVQSAKSCVHGEISLKVANRFLCCPNAVGHQPRNMSLGSKFTSTSCHASYFEAGRRNGWQRRTALVAASAAI